MLEEPAYEFSTGYGDVFGFTGSVVSDGICDRTVSDRLYPGVCNCNPVGISAKIVNGIAETIERFFNIWTPFNLIHSADEGIPGCRRSNVLTGGRKCEAAITVVSFQSIEEFTSEKDCHDLHRSKEASAALTYLEIIGKSAA